MDVQSRNIGKPRVEVLFGERTYLLSELFFCDPCSRVCPPHEVLQTHEVLMCPYCSHTPNAVEATSYFNRCSRCFECPICGTVLTFISEPDPNSDQPVYYLLCGNCYWDSKSKLGLTRHDPKDIVHELINIERVSPTPEDYIPLKSYYKKLDAEGTRQELLRSALKKRYEKYSMMNSTQTFRKSTLLSTSDGVDPSLNDECLIKKQKEDIWANEYPEMLKSALLPRYVELNEALGKQPQVNVQHQQLQPKEGMFLRDWSILDTHKLNQPYDNRPTLEQHLRPNFYYSEASYNNEGSKKDNTQAIHGSIITSYKGNLSHTHTLSDPPLKPQTPVHLHSQTHTLNTSDTMPGQSLPSRVRLISRPTKRCMACNTVLLAYNKAISSSKSSNFLVDHRALNWIPLITLKGTDVIESQRCTLYFMIRNPLEKHINVDFEFEDDNKYTLDVISEPFAVPIDPFDSIQELMDSEDEEANTVEEELSEFIVKSKRNMKLIKIIVSPKPDTIGKAAQFVCKLSLKFEDLVGKNRIIQFRLLNTVGFIMNQHLRTIQSM